MMTREPSRTTSSFRGVIDHDRPETYPAYDISVNMPLAGGQELTTVGWKSTGVDVYFQDGEVLHYDLEGRLLRVAQPGIQWRRGLSGRGIQLRRRSREQGGGLERRQLDTQETERLIREAHDRMQLVQAAMRNRCEPLPEPTDRLAGPDAAPHRLLERCAAFDTQAAREDLARFRSLYQDIPILPPDQYGSLVLLASDGCRYNKCTFCGFYRDTGYRSRDAAEFQSHMEQAVAYHGRGLTLRRGIFLGQANALMGPRPGVRRSWARSMSDSNCRRQETGSRDRSGGKDQRVGSTGSRRFSTRSSACV